jgi:arsenate reductase
MHPSLEKTLAHLPKLEGSIPADRKALIAKIAGYISEKLQKGESVKLNFICTENSRRSHLSQLLAAAIAHKLNVPVETYSGGTKVSACNPRTVAALRRAGFQIVEDTGENPHYEVRYADDADPILAYSKLYDSPENPQDSFIAVMVCGHADENCPFIPNAQKRFAVTFDDPKVADDTLEEAAAYDAKIIEIGAQLFYLFNSIKNG